MTDLSSTFAYATYIKTTPEKLWAALTKPEFMRLYWFGVAIDTDWKAGSPWTMVHGDGRVTDAGQVAECDPPRRIVLSWTHQMNPDLAAEGESQCVIELEPLDGAVKLTILHTMQRGDSKLIQAVSGGWPRILSNLKSYLETGAAILS
jgi:uncharacterized protein YndB with AHSA1/START domain